MWFSVPGVDRWRGQPRAVFRNPVGIGPSWRIRSPAAPQKKGRPAKCGPAVGLIDPKIGDHLQMHQQNGQVVVVKVTELADDTITVDANHPLAGQDLIFELELMEIC